MESIKEQINQPFFMEIMITMCWAIWIMWNDIIFKNISHLVQTWKFVFQKEHVRYSKSKSNTQSTYRFMARRLCVILAFSLTFFVSWTCFITTLFILCYFLFNKSPLGVPNSQPLLFHKNTFISPWKSTMIILLLLNLNKNWWKKQAVVMPREAPLILEHDVPSVDKLGLISCGALSAHRRMRKQKGHIKTITK